VGKNGTGKSRLLRSIVIDLLRDHEDIRQLSDISRDIRENPIGELKVSNMPSKIICASTSPFDKFPIYRRQRSQRYYNYLGLRGLATNNLGLAYLARIIYTLVDAALRSTMQAQAIADVLDYLNYEGTIKVSFGIASPSLLDRLLSSDSPRELIKDFTQRQASFIPDLTASMRQLLDLDDKKLHALLKSAARLLEGNKRPKVEMYLGAFGVEMRGNKHLHPQDVVALGQYGFIRLRDVELQKKNAEEPLMMSEMSSGEQSVIMSLLGIGSQLQDDALICIDEPEVCLHPEWQERYIQLLSHIFSHYKGCHFLIATHSPQIVAQLPGDACYVMQMEDGVVHKSNEFARRSIDFQLATLFKAPGFKNEYLSRIALNTFLKVGKEKVFDEENISNFELLDTAYVHLRNDDPLREIIESLREMHREYGRHK